MIPFKALNAILPLYSSERAALTLDLTFPLKLPFLYASLWKAFGLKWQRSCLREVLNVDRYDHQDRSASCG